MRCEVCGRQIPSKAHRVIIEGAKMTTCSECSKLGSEYWTPKPQGLARRSVKIVRINPRSAIARRETALLSENLVVADGFGKVIRKAREKLGLSHEDLGSKIGEKVSVIRKVERQKTTPDHGLANRLEHALGIKLLVKFVEPEVVLPTSQRSTDITLGDIVHMKKARRKMKDESDRS